MTWFAVKSTAPTVVDWVSRKSTWKSIMKKLIVVASFLTAFAASGFAQTAPARTPAEAGAKMAERDAAYLKAHPAGVKAQAPAAHTTKHAKHNKNAQKSRHAKKSQHHNQHAKKSHHNKSHTA